MKTDSKEFKMLRPPIPTPCPVMPSSPIPSWWPWWLSPAADVIGIGGTIVTIILSSNIKSIRSRAIDIRLEPIILTKIEETTFRIQVNLNNYNLSLKAIDVDVGILKTNLESLGQTTKKAVAKDYKPLLKMTKAYLQKRGTVGSREEQMWEIYRLSHQVIEGVKNEQSRRSVSSI